MSNLKNRKEVNCYKIKKVIILFVIFIFEILFFIFLLYLINLFLKKTGLNVIFYWPIFIFFNTTIAAWSLFGVIVIIWIFFYIFGFLTNKLRKINKKIEKKVDLFLLNRNK